MSDVRARARLRQADAYASLDAHTAAFRELLRLGSSCLSCQGAGWQRGVPSFKCVRCGGSGNELLGRVRIMAYCGDEAAHQALCLDDDPGGFVNQRRCSNCGTSTRCRRDIPPAFCIYCQKPAEFLRHLRYWDRTTCLRAATAMAWRILRSDALFRNGSCPCGRPVVASVDEHDAFCIVSAAVAALREVEARLDGASEEELTAREPVYGVQDAWWGALRPMAQYPHHVGSYDLALGSALGHLDAADLIAAVRPALLCWLKTSLVVR